MATATAEPPSGTENTFRTIYSGIPLSIEEGIFRTDFCKDFDNDAILDFPLLCTICEMSLEPKLVNSRNLHPFLGVLVCNQCYSICETHLRNAFMYTSTHFFCQWCGNSGNLKNSVANLRKKSASTKKTFWQCGRCSLQFCESCVRKNAPETIISLNDECKDWTCFSCDSRPVWSLRALCDLVFSRKEKLNNKPSEQAKQATRSSSACIVCFEAESKVAFYPCGHLCMCDTCVKEYKERYKNCPTCQQDYKDTLIIYFQ